MIAVKQISKKRVDNRYAVYINGKKDSTWRLKKCAEAYASDMRKLTKQK